MKQNKQTPPFTPAVSESTTTVAGRGRAVRTGRSGARSAAGADPDTPPGKNPG